MNTFQKSFLRQAALVLILAFSGCSKPPAANVQFYKQFDATIQLNGLQGFEIAPTVGEKCVYQAMISPLEPSDDGASVKHFIEPECNGKGWHQVIRIELSPPASAPVRVHVVIYKISGGTEPANKIYP